MARARNIKPAFFKNEELVELDFATRLLFIGLWTLADRSGRLEDRPKRIKMEIFPADSVDVDAALTELHDRRFIERYSTDGARYIQVVNFVKHQSPHIKEQESTIPAPDMSGANPVQTSGKHPLNPESGLLNPESGNTENAASGEIAALPLAVVEDGSESDPDLRSNDDEPEDDPPAAPAVSAEKPAAGFDEFWAAYPSRKDKKQAVYQWNRLKPDDALIAVILAAIEVQKQTEKWRAGKIKYPHRWLKDQNWADEIGPEDITPPGYPPPTRASPGLSRASNGAGPYLAADQGIDWDEEERQAKERRSHATTQRGGAVGAGTGTDRRQPAGLPG